MVTRKLGGAVLVSVGLALAPPVAANCGDGTIEQSFAPDMHGCAGSASFDDRAALCGAGFRVCTARDWVARRAGGVPAYAYWTSDYLYWNGGGPANCFVSEAIGNGNLCNASQSMGVCGSDQYDPIGNFCNWTQCGIDTPVPVEFFGGCATTAGTLCCSDASPIEVPLSRPWMAGALALMLAATVLAAVRHTARSAPA